jgi:hypothetical protein
LTTIFSSRPRHSLAMQKDHSDYVLPHPWMPTDKFA